MKKIILSASIVFALITSAIAQWNLDTNVRNPMANFSQYKRYPLVVHDGQGGYYISWTGNAQRVDSLGYIQWAANGNIIFPSSMGLYNPSYALVPSDSATAMSIITYQAYYIAAQRFNSNGDTLFSPHKIVYTHDLYYTISSMWAMPDDSGGAIIIWNQSNGIGSYQTREQRIDRNGNNFWTIPKHVISETSGNVMTDGKNGAYLLYTKHVFPYPLSIERVDRNGMVAWTYPGTFISNTPTNGWGHFGMTYDSLTGGCYFGYFIGAIVDGVNLDKYVQFIDSNGVLRWGNGGLLIAPYNAGITSKQLVSDNNGGFYVDYYLSDYPDTSHLTYVIKHYDQNGNSLWNSADTTVISINERGALKRREFRITPDNTGGIIVLWDELRNNRLCIYSQRYNANGNKMWQSSGFPVITATNYLDSVDCQPPPGCDNMAPQIIDFGPSSALAVWDDNRNGLNSQNIFAAKVDGIIGTGINDNSFLDNELDIFPNPTTEDIKIRFARKEYYVQLYNTLGETIFRTAATGKEFTIDLKHYPKGIYFISVSDQNNNLSRKIVKM
jgi:hypothetical protein